MYKKWKKIWCWTLDFVTFPTQISNQDKLLSACYQGLIKADHCHTLIRQELLNKARVWLYFFSMNHASTNRLTFDLQGSWFSLTTREGRGQGGLGIKKAHCWPKFSDDTRLFSWERRPAERKDKGEEIWPKTSKKKEVQLLTTRQAACQELAASYILVRPNKTFNFNY